MARPPDPADQNETDQNKAARSTATAIPATAEGARRIGKYEIQKKLGAGGMGAVYLAIDGGLKRAVALKVLPKEKASNPTLVKRFKAEAQSAANLRHENIVTVYEAGEADGYLYIALEYVEGTDAANLVLKRGPVPVKRSVEIVRQVALGLKHAHQQQIVHRDIKPGNLLLRRDGVVKLADLGLARAIDDNTDTSITRAGTTVGTVDFMSPEQARNSKAADVRSDIYSLGCTWYYLLTGSPPFPDGSLTNKLRAHAENQLPDPRDLNPSVTEAVYAVLRRMTEKEPAKRYQTPAELIEDLDTTNFTNDMVSEAILSELEEDGPKVWRKPVRSQDDEAESDGAAATATTRRKRGKTVSEEPVGPTSKRNRKEREKPQPQTELGRVIMFYTVVAGLAVGLIAGLAVLVQQFSSAVDVQSDGSGHNPFDAGKAPGPTENIKKVNPQGQHREVVEGEAGGDSGGQKTIRVTPDASGEGTVVSPGSALVSQGPTTTRISSGPQMVSSVDLNPAAAEQRIRREESLLPDWAMAPISVSGLPVLTVSRDGSGPGHFRSLNTALDQVTSEGALIRLEGPGPFPLRGQALAEKKRIVLQVASAARPASGQADVPLVVLLPPETRKQPSLLDLTNTSLELEGVHLAIDAATYSPEEALIHVRGGNLILRRSSVSVRGGSGALAALKVSGKPGAAAGASDSKVRILLERTLIRGNSLTGLVVDTDEADAVIRRSMIWSGSEPAIRLAGKANTESSRRQVRSIASTLCSSDGMVRIADSATAPISTTFQWVDSMLVAPHTNIADASPAMVWLDGWNQGEALAALGKTYRWKSSDTLYLGWKSFVRLAAGPALVTDASEWNKIWKDDSLSAKAAVQKGPWPTDTVSDVLTVDPARLTPETVGKQYIKTAEGGWPGCGTDLLASPGLAALDAVQGLANRPRIPAGLLDFPATETVSVDLNKEDLGRFLTARPPRQGTLIVAKGSGQRPSSPILIENVWLRIQFEQAEGAPLVLTPRTADVNRDDAFITVRNGGLELRGAAITASLNAKQPLPQWFIRVDDGDLVLRQSRIQGPLLGSSRNKGLIQWTRTAGHTPPRPFEGLFEGYLVTDGCFLAGSGTLIEADLRRRGLFLKDSLAVTREDLLAINLSGEDSQILGVVDLESSTLSASGSVFKLDAAPLPAPTSAGLSVFADRTVFGPAFGAGPKASPSLLTFTGDLFGTRQLNWWENRCGYAPDIGHFIRREGSLTDSAQDFAAWAARWNPAHVIDPLTGGQGVFLRTPLPQRAEDRAKLEPGDFALHPTSRAATWDGGNRPIGAPVAELKIPLLRAPANTGAKTKPAGTPKTPQPRPGF